MDRDLSYTPKMPHELDALSKVADDDLLHAQQTADRLATAKLQRLLEATDDKPTSENA